MYKAVILAMLFSCQLMMASPYVDGSLFEEEHIELHASYSDVKTSGQHRAPALPPLQVSVNHVDKTLCIEGVLPLNDLNEVEIKILFDGIEIMHDYFSLEEYSQDYDLASYCEGKYEVQFVVNGRTWTGTFVLE